MENDDRGKQAMKRVRQVVLIVAASGFCILLSTEVEAYSVWRPLLLYGGIGIAVAGVVWGVVISRK